MPNRSKPLIASSDPGIRRLLRRHFEEAGCGCTVASTAEEALVTIHRSVVDLVVASVEMPDMDGLSFIAALREGYRGPLMALAPPNTAFAVDRLLRAGADDCLEEPFGLDDFAARARRLLLRGGVKYRSRTMIDGLGLLEIEPSGQSVRLDGRPIALTRREFGVLAVLSTANGQPVASTDILREVWGGEHIGAVQNLRRVVGTLRQKVEPNPEKPAYLINVRNGGYRLSAGTAAADGV